MNTNTPSLPEVHGTIAVPQGAELTIAADGTITWGNGRARHVYVMSASARSPTVWPNLDLPEGTLVRVETLDGDVDAVVSPDRLVDPDGERMR